MKKERFNLEKKDFEDLGFIDKDDRGMSENNGWLFQHGIKKHLYIKFWNTRHEFLRAKRVEIYQHSLGTLFNGYPKNKEELKLILEILDLKNR